MTVPKDPDAVADDEPVPLRLRLEWSSGSGGRLDPPLRKVPGVYELLVAVHILSGIAWVGGAFLFMLSARGVRDSEGHAAAERMMARMEKASRLMNPAPFLVLITGITMVAVNDSWAFSQVWVYVSLALFALALTLGAVFEDGLQKRMEQARNEGRHEPQLLDRFIRIGFLDLAIFTGIVLLMVYKPV